MHGPWELIQYIIPLPQMQWPTPKVRLRIIHWTWNYWAKVHDEFINGPHISTTLISNSCQSSVTIKNAISFIIANKIHGNNFQLQDQNHYSRFTLWVLHFQPALFWQLTLTPIRVRMITPHPEPWQPVCLALLCYCQILVCLLSLERESSREEYPACHAVWPYTWSRL